MLLTDALNEFLFDCRLRKLSEGTLKRYKNNNLKFFQFLKTECSNVELERFNYKMAQLYITELSDLGRESDDVIVGVKSEGLKQFIVQIVIKKIMHQPEIR